MAITKAVSGNPVRGYYVETIQTGRTIRKTGGVGTSGFGQPRLGGLQNAIVDGLAGGGTGAARMQDVRVAGQDQRVADLNAKMAKEAEQSRVKQHDEFIADRKEVAKTELETHKKADELRKQEAEAAAKHADNKPADNRNKVEVVKDPRTGESKVTAPNTTDASVLNDPKTLAGAEKKPAEQQAKEAAPAAPANEKK